jgi:hypothetical protein
MDVFNILCVKPRSSCLLQITSRNFMLGVALCSPLDNCHKLGKHKRMHSSYGSLFRVFQLRIFRTHFFRKSCYICLSHDVKFHQLSDGGEERGKTPTMSGRPTRSVTRTISLEIGKGRAAKLGNKAKGRYVTTKPDLEIALLASCGRRLFNSHTYSHPSRTT